MTLILPVKIGVKQPVCNNGVKVGMKFIRLVSEGMNCHYKSGKNNILTIKKPGRSTLKISQERGR